MIIEIEGVDGVGKTTCISILKSLLDERSINHVLTKEAGNPFIPICMTLRELALDPQYNLSKESMECLFLAQRIENAKWYQCLDSQTVVVSDRGLLSHFAYGYAALDIHQVDALFRTFCKTINETMKPYIIYLKADANITAQRRQTRGAKLDNVEILGNSHQEKVARNFDQLLQEQDLYHQMWTIDANQDRDGVKSQLETILNQIFRC